jgi:hypothetical protein
MLSLLKQYVYLIQDIDIRTDLIHLLGKSEVQSAFSKGSTYSGSNHPEDENKAYGLLLHSLRVVNVAIQLLRSDYSVQQLDYDILIASGILHDVPFKFKENGYTDLNHAHSNAVWFSENTTLTGDSKSKILSCILHHMGRWDTSTSSDKEKYPLTNLAWVLHLADNLASRKNILVNVDCVDYLKVNLDLS